ncbi:TonB-dependent receptor, partial [Porticoccaceae bacterium]|nr:TonB-dependent receptor [Porticoccaceae bacterium]
QGVDGDQEAATQQSQIDEIIVTANKRADGASLQDTAMSISVLSSETINNRGLVSASDYLATIPGVSFSELGATDKKIVIRGLSSGDIRAESAVGTYLGEIPLGTGAFDVKLVDIERIEVLKGPQGTLYGSDAFSGVIRNIPVAPNLQDVEGNIKINSSSQSESDDFNSSVVGALNIPLVSNQLALRVAAYHFDNAGYVDSISTPLAESIATDTGSTVTVKDDIGGNTFTGARATLLWEANDQLDISLTVGTQEVEVEGSSETQRGLGSYQATYLNRSPGKIETVDFDYTNLMIEYDLGWANLMSSTSSLKGNSVRGYNFFTIDPNAFLGPVSWDQSIDTDHFVEEVRLASQLEGPWQFVAGLFYEDLKQDTKSRNDWEGSDLDNPFAPNTLWLQSNTQSDREQKAVFGELSYAFNEQWELTVGGRYFDYTRVDTVEDLPAALNPGGVSIVDASETGTTYRANLSFAPNDDTLIYAQWSEGFRLGKGQQIPSAALCDIDNNGKLDFTDADLTDQIKSDTTENIELGAKFTFLDTRLTLNTAIFTIDWSDLPSRISGTSAACPLSIFNNIGEASSKGVEMDANYLITPQLAINLSASYVEAEWEDTTGITATPGEYLSFAPRSNANLGFQYDFDLNRYPAFARVDISYVGEYETAFQFNELDSAGDYINVNLRLGVEISQWSLALYATNLANDEGIITTFVAADYRVAPRRLGLEANYRF